MATTDHDFFALKQTAPKAVLEKMQEWKGMGESLLKSLVDCFSDIESREQALISARESLEKREKGLEEREKKFDVFEEERKGELMVREKFLDEQLTLVGEHIESLEAEQGKIEGFRNRRNCEKLKEIENREREIDVVGKSIEERLREIERREREFDKLCNGKLGELGLKEEKLRKEKKQFAEEVKLVNEELMKKQKVGCDLIERLESALKLLNRIKAGVDERLKEMESWEAKAHENLTAKINEADLIKDSLEKRFKEIEKIEEEFDLFQKEKTQLLELQELQLRAMRKDLLKDVKLREEQLSERQKLGDRISQRLEHMVSKEIESLDDSARGADLSRESSNNQELKWPVLPEARNAHSMIDSHERVDLSNALQKDGRILEMFINRRDEDMELMDDEIFKVLMLSSDPAKFVLDAVDGLYTLKLGKGSEDSKLKSVCILLLDELTKMCPIIQPSVRGEAIKLALELMSNLNASAENPLEVLVLLHLLAAYNLSSHFDKNELFSFAKLVVQHKQTPRLCRVLGLAEKIPDLIQSLIHEKQYLLASTYIYEFGLGNMFPQGAVLDYYVKHSRMSAKKSFEAQDMAIVREIADLRVGIEHIIKYGLESEYSPQVLTDRIKQLERNQASFKCRSPSSSGDLQKPGKGKRSWDAYNRMDVQQKQHEERRYSPPWKAQNWQGRRDVHPYTSPGGFHFSRSQKRRRKKAYDSIHDGKINF